MHVYHYGGYESGAVKRLMQRHHTREDEVDQLLRGGVFVDLFNVVRQGIRASVESYSIKRIEHFYMSQREGPVTEAGFSVVQYETWRRDDAHPQQLLDELAAYNRDDCVSTWKLRDWLEARRQEAIARGWAMPRPRPPELRPERRDAREAGHHAPSARRRSGRASPRTQAVAQPQEQARWLLSRLVDWHRREDRPAWWNWFRLREMPLEELIEQGEAIGGLEFVGDVRDEKKSVVRRYRFPRQEVKLRPGKDAVDPDHPPEGLGSGAGDILDIDDEAGTIDLLRGPTRLGFHPVRLLPATPLQSNDAARGARCRRRLGHRARRRRRRAVARRLATCCSGGHRGSSTDRRRVRCSATASPASTPRVAWRSSWIAACSASRGHRHGQDVDRRAHGRRARSRRAGASASLPSPTRRSRTCCGPSMTRRARPTTVSGHPALRDRRRRGRPRSGRAGDERG